MERAKVIVFAGQSNAVGVGCVRYLPKHFDEKTVEKFKSVYENGLINYYSHNIKSGGISEIRSLYFQINEYKKEHVQNTEMWANCRQGA